MRRAYTVFEILIVMVILSLLFLMMTPIFFYSKTTESVMKKIDVYHDARQVNYAITPRIKLASRILFPSSKFIGKKEWFHQIIFLNYLQQTIVIYVNDKKELIEVNYDQIDNNKLCNFKKIGTNIKQFEVRRITSNLIELRINYSLPDNKEYSITNKINLINVI